MLEEYRKKRNFSKTPEPEPGNQAKSAGNRFVVQEHHASHLHWDFRLEMDGVLKSWAVPKGMPQKKGEKRLAVQTEDHPLEYIDFEGEIPEGQYGAGTVLIWDRGTYRLKEREEGKIEFELEGEKLKGKFVLIRFKGQDKNWLLIKLS
jgi:DNA ligase D-like protein (predicted 3'-phosphoesterase)